ncbi:MAG: FAD-binding oxidoreductase [Alphaproteobacteria bacterium]|nr:MAG: FAD-binding oxidoreductase [Alphaproteobacteria bacterium]
MLRRTLIKLAGGLPLMSTAAHAQSYRRVRSGEAGWPTAAQWQELDAQVGGRLIAVTSPLEVCRAAPQGDACTTVFRTLKNPWAIGDSPALTQTSGWAGAWTSSPSAYAVPARDAQDVAAAVKFARAHRLRIAVKGGGHSYQGTSNAPDSLLIWTRKMDRIELHDAFVPQGCSSAPQPAVSLGAGVVWLHAYAAVTQAGRYVQGGGCTTVGVAGLIQSGGFGSFSKRYGLAAASLLEAEVVTADGAVRLANACTNSDLFWALKGGGGGSFGVITRITLKTHELPQLFGAALAGINANSDAAFKRLVERFVTFYRDSLFNPTWGESVTLRPENVLEVTMVFQGIDQERAAATWKPFLDWVRDQGSDYGFVQPAMFLHVPARSLWDAAFLKQNAPQMVLTDERPGAPATNVFWRGNLGEAGWFLHAYQSTWMPAALLADDKRPALADALFAASRRWRLALHFNKGLAGAPAEAIAAARDTATNPAAMDAFALAISAAEGPPAFAGIAGHEPDLARASANAERVTAAMAELRKLVPQPGSYVSESDYFEADWRQAFWGANYARLKAVKDKVDPDGLFFVHHGVGSEDWSSDGFTRLK